MAIGDVINALALFVFHNLFFIINHALGDGIDEITKLIGFGPNHFFKGIGGGSLVKFWVNKIGKENRRKPLT